jgi:hypothetical protein
MDDDQFNTLKYKLPFLLKKDKDQFYVCVALLRKEVNSLTNFQLVDLFYTFHSLNMSRLWLSYLQDIYDLLTLPQQIDILKFTCLNIDTEDHINIVKLLADKTFKTVINDPKKDILAFEISFLSSKFFKPLLFSQLKTMRVMNRNLSQYLTEKCLEIISDTNIKLICLEKLGSSRSYTQEEKDYLLKLADSSDYVGRILDICIRNNDSDMLSKAYSILHKEKDIKVYNRHNAVHYFDIKPEILNNINIVETSTLLTDVDELINISKLLPCSVDVIYYIVNIILSSSYELSGVSIEKIFVYLWSLLCDFEEKKCLVEEIATYDSTICCYGLVINLFIFIGAIKNKELLDLNNLQDQVIDKLKEIYPPDHDFWSDVTLIEKEMKSMASQVVSSK